MTEKSAGAHPLQIVFDPNWTPSVDKQLIGLRDEGVPLDRIATALMRPSRDVQQRWNRLRVVPGIRALLRDFGATLVTYPAGGGHAQ